jgi:hypothetical protein
MNEVGVMSLVIQLGWIPRGSLHGNGISSARGASMSLSVGVVSFVFLPRLDARGYPRGMVKP